MSWRPDDGHGPDFGGAPSSSSRSVPIYVLFLIMLASGIFTLVLLWICVQCIYHKRRIRRARAADDIERNAAAQRPWQAEAPVDGAPAKDLEADVKRCDASEVELTYVVMAGEEQPTFLAKPLGNTNSSEEEKPSVSSLTKLERDEALVAAKPEKTSAS